MQHVNGVFQLYVDGVLQLFVNKIITQANVKNVIALNTRILTNISSTAKEVKVHCGCRKTQTGLKRSLKNKELINVCLKEGDRIKHKVNHKAITRGNNKWKNDNAKGKLYRWGRGLRKEKPKKRIWGKHTAGSRREVVKLWPIGPGQMALLGQPHGSLRPLVSALSKQAHLADGLGPLQQ